MSTVPSSTPAMGTPSPTGSHSATDAMKEKAAQVGQQAADMANSAKEAAAVRAEQAREQAMQYVEQGRAKAMELSSQVEAYVRQEPTKALLAAAGVGFAVGFLLIRR